MFNLPKSTNIKKPIYKNLIFRRFPKQLKGNRKKSFDEDISRMTITNEISEASVNIKSTENLSAIFVLQVELKKKKYDDYNIILLSKLFGQKLLIVLRYKDECKLAIYETKLLTSSWKKEDDIKLRIEGLDLESVWKNLVIQVSQIEIESGNTLSQQIDIESRKNKIEKEITKLNKRARKENQSKKKFDLFKQIKKLESKLEDLNNG